MGKVRVKTIGIEEIEKKEKETSRLVREDKRTVKAPGLKGGQRVVAVGPSEEELKAIDSQTPQTEAKSKKKEKFAKVKARSKRYQAIVQMIDKSKTYSINEALELLSKFQKAKFDETVELHLNTVKTGISANLTLPHGTGKKTRVAVADDKIVSEIEQGEINFDILLAQPTIMSKLARVAKILGPKGLMPNPKNGTITQNPKDLIKKYEEGQVSFKTEAKSPLIHLTVGKFSFGDKKLSDNINAILQAVKPEDIQKINLKSQFLFTYL